MVKISDNYEYVLDTSVLMSAVLNYAAEMKDQNPESNENYDIIHDVCFYILSELIRAKIAIDTSNMLKDEYEKKVFDKYPLDYPAQWYTMMERSGRIIPKNIIIDKYRKAEMHRFFGLSRIDCCLIHIAECTSSKKIFHRDNGITNASGYVNKHFGVVPVNVMRD